MPRLTLVGTLLLLAGAVIAGSDPTLTEPLSRDNSDECDCYLVSGPDPGYFQYYRFWDFRNIFSEGDEDFNNPPPLVTSSQNSGGQDVTAAFFDTNEWNDDWSILNDLEEPNATVPSINSAQNVFISTENGEDGNDFTYLTFRASRPSESFVSTAEIDSSQDNVLHSSIRTRARIIPLYLDGSAANVVAPIEGVNASHPVAPGACFGFFTYRSDTQESDIEILTYDPVTDVRYSNQPDFNARTDEPVPGASTQSTMPDGKVWTDWHDHRIDWYNGISRWYVDGDLVLEKSLDAPTEPSALLINLWSDGGFWTGNMSVGSQVTAGLQWIEMAFNVSGVTKGPQHKLGKRKRQKRCSIGCNIDGVQDIGTPIVAFNVTGIKGDASDANGKVSIASQLVQVVLAFWAVLLTSMM
ncbi:hypothetical protein H2198_007938 [Neophaeococcomyces mojaviensis]|uniref:Uncharacterized protein n=1 Tax=Neophaeococcomyces mojaviensis TaxID=3383035 RepID=A0ACC2ZZ98_9EURO|nr:hypothetical protein H2198_007938 [Knufia sp. JES_112]